MVADGPARPLLVSHRTNMGSMPENSLAGIDAAIADGVDGVEFDVRATADGALVLVHDDTLARTTGDARAVASVTLAAVRALALRDPARLAPPQCVPTLDEALARCAGRVAPVVDICARGLVGPVAAAVARAGAAGACRLTGPDADELAALKARLPDAVATLSVQHREGAAGLAAALAAARRLGLDGVNPDHRLVDAALLRTAQAAGLIVTTWTVNDADEARRLRDLGVASITTNDPARIGAAL